MIKSIYIIDKDGVVLIEKQYYEKTSRNQLEPVCHAIQNNAMPPSIIESIGTIYILSKENDLYIVGACNTDSPTSFASAIVSSIGGILSTTMKNGFNINSVKTEYPLIYQMLDMFLDSGYPLLEEQSIISSAISNNYPQDMNINREHPWRTEKNLIKGSGEIYIESVETIEARINSLGKSDLLIVRGSINMHSKLQGSPNVTVSISVPHVLEDYSFHRCIDPSQHLSRKFTFVPPDGDFTMMTYFARPQITNLPLFVVPKFSWSKVNVVFEVTVRLDDKLPKTIHDVKISFSLPEGISIPSLAVASGTAAYDIAKRIIRWDVDTNNREYMILSGSASIEKDFNPKACDITIMANFVATGFTASGLQFVKLEVENSNAAQTIKYITKSGTYVFCGNSS